MLYFRSAIVCLSFFVCFSVSSLSFAGDSPLGTNKDSVVVFGGSFSPPTKAHLGLLLRTMIRFEIPRAIALVASPYKKGAVPGNVSLELTRVAVENAHEVLADLSIDAKVLSTQEGQIVFEAGGRNYQIDVSDFDLRNRIVGNALKSITHFASEFGGLNVYWLSGADSAESTPTWNGEWQKLYNVNWIMVNRPGHENEKAITTSRNDPIRAALGNEFVDRFDYAIDEKSGVHRYTRQGEAGIYVVDLPNPNVSSTGVRESLKGDQEEAQANLQPSVFRRAVEKGYYREEGREWVYTRENLEEALKNMMNFQGVNHIDPALLQATMGELVRHAKLAADEHRGRPAIYAVILGAFEELREFFRIRGLLYRFKKKFDEMIFSVGVEVAGVYLGLELAERFLTPFIGYWMGGVAGAAASPWLHHEYFTFPAYFLIKYGVKKLKRWRLVDADRFLGNRSLYQKVLDYQSRLLGGDRRTRLARVKLFDGLGLDQGEIELNIVKSRLPSWVPLRIRNLDDRSVNWYDVNLSTNELKSLVGDDALVRELRDSAGSSLTRFASLLLAAVLSKDTSRSRLAYFAQYRYFKKLILGDFPPEMLVELSPEERRLVKRIGQEMPRYESGFDSSYREEFRETVVHLMIIRRFLKVNPEQGITPGFWHNVIQLLATRYPGREVNYLGGKTLERVSRQLRSISAALAAEPESFMRGHGRVLEEALFSEDGFSDEIRWGSEIKSSADRQFSRENRGYSDVTALYETVKNFAKEFRLPTLNRRVSFNGRFEVVDIWDERKESERRGLQVQIHDLESRLEKRLHWLEKGYQFAIRHLDILHPTRKRTAKAIFRDGLYVLTSDVKALLTSLEEVGVRWTVRRYENKLADTDQELASYDYFYREVQKHRLAIESRLNRLQQLNATIQGMEEVPLDSEIDLKAYVSQLVDVPKNRLGRGIGYKLGTSFWDRIRGKTRNPCRLLLE